jgi:hypothetical protein
MVIGMTTPGKRTAFRSGSMDNRSGISSAFIISISSVDIKGINSVSFSMTSLKAGLLSNSKKLIV